MEREVGERSEAHISRRSVERVKLENQAELAAANQDAVSRAPSQISKAVVASNQKADDELRSRIGLSAIPKTRPEDGSKIVSQYASAAESGDKKEIAQYFQTLARTDKAQYDKLVYIAKMCSKQDLDMRQLG